MRVGEVKGRKKPIIGSLGHLCFESAVKLHQESKKLTEDDKLLKKLAAVRKVLSL